MSEFSVAGQRVVVVGAARSGLAAAELLVKRGATVTLTDVKASIPEEEQLQGIGVTLALGGHDPAAFDGADLIVMSPGVPMEQPGIVAAQSRGVPVIGELELASRWLKGRVIAITGTKGKSTTTTLVGRMLRMAGLRVRVGGNIGVPVSAQVEDSTKDTIHVIEVSSFQLEATDTFHPWIAALLNFSPDHLDRHPNEAAYGAAKQRVFANQTPQDWTVVNADNAAALDLAAPTRGTVVRYAVDNGAGADVYVEGDVIWRRAEDGGAIPLVPIKAIELAGHHMLSNVAAASTVSYLAGVPPTAMVGALDGFTGLEHVMEPVATIGGVRFVNDSKATNIDAAARSIESFDNVVAIIGGRYKGGDFEDLAAPLRRHGRGLVAIGESRSRVRDALGGVVPFAEAATFGDAVRQAYEMAKPDGVVLLAPACSSFDMFVDYADRGRAFKAAVEELRTKNEERRTQNE